MNLTWWLDLWRSLFGESPGPGKVLPAPTSDMLVKHNVERLKVGAPPLAENARLTLAAQTHAHWMADRSTLSHNDSYGDGPAQRVTRTGYRWSRVAENIADEPSGSEAEAFGLWMTSPGHKRNILDPLVRDFGYAAARGRDGQWYWCAVFAAPA